jgi:type IV secretory pathway VirB3-like protein
MNVGKAELANIGSKETRKRLLMGVTMLAVSVVMAVIFTHAGVSRGWYSVLFLPFWMGTLAVSQARKKT